MVTITCHGCGAAVESQRRSRKWCSRCVTRAQTLRAGPITRDCRWCREPFTTPRGRRGDTSRRYCSREHARLAASRQRIESKQRCARGERRYGGRPRTLTDSERDGRLRESRLDRYLRKHPELKRECEACGESRVVEMAHKPHAKRNGAHPSGYVQTDDVWLLCPTCHRVVDYGIQTPEELGLALA